MIVSNVRRHLAALANASKAYAEAISSAIKFLIAENDRMAKDLQEARQSIDQFVGFAMVEMRKSMLTEVSTLETTMRKMYGIFFTMHKTVVHLYGSQQ